jgi:hypothetical protein
VEVEGVGDAGGSRDGRWQMVEVEEKEKEKMDGWRLW